MCGSGRLRQVPDEVDAGFVAVIDAGVAGDSGTVVIEPAVDAGPTTADARVVIIDAGVRDAGPMACIPNEGLCVGSVAQVCTPDGQGFVADVTTTGCEFWPAILGQQLFGYVGHNTYAVAIANAGLRSSSVTIEGGMLTSPLTISVPPQSVSVQSLSDRAAQIPFRLRATWPVSVVQFNPLFQKVGTVSTHSCDASLLRPTHTWGRQYVVASWPVFSTSPGLIGVVTREATTLTITPRAATVARNGAPALAANVASTLTLDAGVFLELGTLSGDLTGTLISADHPIEVIGGHNGAKIPADIDASDHLEEGLMPIEQLSNEYFVISPALVAIPAGKAQIVRIIAAENDLELSYEPPRLGAPTHLEHAGDFIELDPGSAVFRVQSTKKVLVAQYMQAQALGGAMGDPSMFIAPPRSQFKTDHVFHSPPDYEMNAVDIVAPTGTTVTLDGAAVSGFVSIGSTDHGLSRNLSLGLGQAANGTHRVTCSAPCMLSVYGYGQYISYWYPGN